MEIKWEIGDEVTYLWNGVRARVVYVGPDGKPLFDVPPDRPYRIGKVRRVFLPWRWLKRKLGW